MISNIQLSILNKSKIIKLSKKLALGSSKGIGGDAKLIRFIGGEGGRSHPVKNVPHKNLNANCMHLNLKVTTLHMFL
jgi:hypothetical protein